MTCGECTLCCTLCEVKDINKPAGEPCKHCASNCVIYDARPQGCRDFTCAYAQMEEVNILMRPDKCGVVFEKMSESQVLGMVDPDRDEYPHVKGQIEAFRSQGYEVILNGEINGCSGIR